MLFLLFELDGDRYALDAGQIVEVMEFSPVKRIPGAPPWIAGAIEGRESPVPVIDVAQLALGRPSRRLRSTRFVVVRYGTETAPRNETSSEAGTGRQLALIVERATQTLRIDPDQFIGSGVATPNARWLGPVASDEQGLVQWVDAHRMLDDEARALLFPTEAPTLLADRP